MSIDISETIITGAIFSYDQLGADFVDKVLGSEEIQFDNNVELLQTDPYDSEPESFPDFILGIIDKEIRLDRAMPDEKSSLEIIEENPKNRGIVESEMQKQGLNVENHPIKKYKIVYFC